MQDSMPSARGVLFSIVIIGVLFSQFQIVQSIPFRPTNCTEFKKLEGGNKAADNYTSALYDFKSILKSSKKKTDEASESLSSLHKFVAVAGLYRQILHDAKDKPQFANYTGFNNLRIIHFFEAMITYLLKDICTWITSYNTTMKNRLAINCSHPSELMLLGQHSMVSPLIPYTINTWEPQFDCSKSSSNWIDLFIRPQYQSEVDFLQRMEKK
ncbi:PREDICTED: uncharacterized protein LOC109582582 [Amphimedon queenslandica]|uniref:Uncharacterized protein n=1 Tax=Amphimedon queenslandica TaxID=400682 RepID=A0A1X7UQZ5_AMPQE|nr:PREDICTED: uncharacterized protein LOC109582582 [Amphimedon queenslandica]|eukprot:XP_019852902.1 PREDICTED: uncharacterized protein LOC109582582 [Amphimedon queenslandica]